MYKALDIRDDTEVVILDPKWLRSIDQLREFDHQNFLVCQGCRQPVRVRAGEQRREHFAHKHLANCDYSDESAVLRNARAVLYEWLVSKFGENVTIEKKIDGIDLFRPVDCWVNQNSTVFAYWIFDSGLKPEKRNILADRLERSGIHIHWIFALEMLHTEQDHPDKLVLSTTEREFIRRSKYDTPFTKAHFVNGSLHYLDAQNRRLLTFRGLSLYHEPQVYRGVMLSGDLEKVLVSPQNGEFVHDGEHEKLQNYEQQLKAIDAAPNQRWARFAFQRNPNILNPSLGNDSVENAGKTENRDLSYRNIGVQRPENTSRSNPMEKTGVCIFCGQKTQDWWWYDGKSGRCKCRACLQQGKA